MTRRTRAVAIAAAIAALATPSGAHDGFENRTGLRSAPVIANDMRQMGLDPGAVKLMDGEARVSVRVRGKLATLSVDRLTGATRMLSGDPTVAAPLRARLGRVWRAAPVAALPILRLDPRVTPQPFVRSPLRLQPQD